MNGEEQEDSFVLLLLLLLLRACCRGEEKNRWRLNLQEDSRIQPSGFVCSSNVLTHAAAAAAAVVLKERKREKNYKHEKCVCVRLKCPPLADNVIGVVNNFVMSLAWWKSTELHLKILADLQSTKEDNLAGCQKLPHNNWRNGIYLYLVVSTTDLIGRLPGNRCGPSWIINILYTQHMSPGPTETWLI